MRKSQKDHQESLILSHSQEMKRFKSFSRSNSHIYLFFSIIFSFAVFLSFPSACQNSSFISTKDHHRIISQRDDIIITYFLYFFFSLPLTAKALDSACTPNLPRWRDGTPTPRTQFLPRICCVLATPQAFFSGGYSCFQWESISSFWNLLLQYL